MIDQLCIYHVDLNHVAISPAYLRTWLKELADMGYNAILWEVEDKIQWTTCPDAVWPEAFSKEEFKEILAEAAELGLEAIPLLQTIGHGEYILKHEAYKHMRELPEHHDCYCTLMPEVRTFLKNMINEYLELFGDIRHFHLGGDEAYRFAQCPQCSARAEELGHNGLYAEHILDLAGPIKTAGARAGIWCDMVLNHPDEMDAIPAELEIWDWNYWDVEGPMDAVRVWGQGLVKAEEITPELKQEFPEIVGNDGQLRGFYTANALKRMGYDVILCSAVRSAGDSFFCPKTRLHTHNIAGAARKAVEAGLIGTCVTDWAIRFNSWETHKHLLPLAPMILKDPKPTTLELLTEITDKMFGCDSAPFIKAVDALTENSFPFGQAHSTGVQWSGLKDSVPPPAGYIAEYIDKADQAGKLDAPRNEIESIISQIATAKDDLMAFARTAPENKQHLGYWLKAADLNLRQAAMAREFLNGNRNAEHAATLKQLKKEYEVFLRFDQTAASAKQNADLVYDTLIEYMEG